MKRSSLAVLATLGLELIISGCGKHEETLPQETIQESLLKTRLEDSFKGKTRIEQDMTTYNMFDAEYSKFIREGSGKPPKAKLLYDTAKLAFNIGEHYRHIGKGNLAIQWYQHSMEYDLKLIKDVLPKAEDIWDAQKQKDTDFALFRIGLAASECYKFERDDKKKRERYIYYHLVFMETWMSDHLLAGNIPSRVYDKVVLYGETSPELNRAVLNAYSERFPDTAEGLKKKVLGEIIGRLYDPIFDTGKKQTRTKFRKWNSMDIWVGDEELIKEVADSIIHGHLGENSPNEAQIKALQNLQGKDGTLKGYIKSHVLKSYDIKPAASYESPVHPPSPTGRAPTRHLTQLAKGFNPGHFYRARGSPGR